MDGFRLQKPFSFFEKRCQLTWCKWKHALSWPAMSILELLEQELAAAQTAMQRDRAELQKKIAVVQQQSNLIEQKDALLSEQSTTIRKQEEKEA